MRVLAADIASRIGLEAELSGWVHRVRTMGKIRFVVLRDRSGFAQLVYAGADAPGGAGDFSLESVLTVRGKVVANPKSPQGAELEVAETVVLSRADPELPFPINRDPSELGIDQILDNRILSLRNPKIRAIFELQSSILRYASEFMHAEGFREIKTSKLIGQGTEGGSNLFQVDYFGQKMYLAQSPQFYKQAMISSGLERVFEISHAYRAEKHDTPRHISEFVSFDVEMAFIESDRDLMDFERRILASIFGKLLANDRAALDQWGATVPDPDLMAKIPVVPCDQAKKIVAGLTGHPCYDINPEAERLVCDWALKEFGVEAAFINDWPRRSRAFYSYPASARTAMSFDLIFRGLEITSGSRRISDYAMLLDTLPRFGLTEEGLGEYPKIFKYGCPPHGGFAIGVERLTQKLLGLANIKEASPFPRDRRRVTP
jgi:nondiscriminating aspartyl-tRNA synthetase